MSPDVRDPATVLAAAETSVHTRRAAALEDLQLVLAWADLHGDDPQDKPGAIPVRYGGDQLIDIGGDGTPWVQDLCLGELAIARHSHLLSPRSVMADALDLRHRLPLTWAVVQTLACEAWVACRVESMTRKLTLDQVALVDTAVAKAIGGCAPGRVLRIVEAKIIEADTAAHTARIEEERRTRTVVLSPTDDTGLRMLFARLEGGDAVWIDATVDRVADLLAADPDLRAQHHPDLPEDITKAELRAVALAGSPGPTTSPSCWSSSTRPPKRVPARSASRQRYCTSTSTKQPSTSASASRGSKSSDHSSSTRSGPSSPTPTSRCGPCSTAPRPSRSTATNTPPP